MVNLESVLEAFVGMDRRSPKLASFQAFAGACTNQLLAGVKTLEKCCVRRAEKYSVSLVPVVRGACEVRTEIVGRENVLGLIEGFIAGSDRWLQTAAQLQKGGEHRLVFLQLS